jgi:two-component system, NarL family, response regulator LiaR
LQKVLSVALVDDHTLVRQGIRAFLDLEPKIHVVAEAGTGQAAIQIAAEHRPDVMLLDLIMPDISGIETAKQVKQVSAHTQIVILTSCSEDEHVLPALRAGALSYVIKDVNVEELVGIIRNAADGGAFISPRIATRVVQEVREFGSDGLSQLSEREYEVLLKIAAGYGNASIAQQLVISERTVKSHVSSILSKLNMTDRTQLAVFAWLRGLISRHTSVTFAHSEGKYNLRR